MGLDDILELPSESYEARQFLPAVPAVYFAVVNATQVGYIGSTYSLRTRWQSHNKRDALLALGSVRVHYLTMSGDAPDNFIEQDAIMALQPLLNRAPARWGWYPHAGRWLPAAIKRNRRKPGRPRSRPPSRPR